MSQDDSSARIDIYLSCLRRLKETSSRREVVEREILLAVLSANRGRIAELPAQEAEQQALATVIVTLSEPQPAHEYYREWMTQFLAALNQYEVALRTGANDPTGSLIGQLLNLEALLTRCIQGFIIFSGVVRDEFNDVIIKRFGEAALADIDEVTHAGFSNDHYWKALLDRFVFGFLNKAYGEVLEKERFRLAREGSFVAVRFPLDAITEQMPGTDKLIDKTRLQAAYHAARQDPQARKAAVDVSSLLASLAKPMLPPKASRHDFELLAGVASMDPAAEQFVKVFVEGQPLEDSASPAEPDADNPDLRAARIEAGKEFLKNQLLAMAAGTALAMGILREDIGKALQGFTAREQEKLLAIAGTFEPEALALSHTLMLEFALCRLLDSKVEDEGAKVQVKCLKQHRSARSEVEELGKKGFNRIRQKLFFEDDPASRDWLLFKAKSAQELAEALKLSNIEPELAQAMSGLWTRMEFKTEAVVLVNLALVAKAAQNIQAKVGEILAKLGVVKAAQA